MDFTRRAKILDLVETSTGVWSWQESAAAWAKPEPTSKSNYFSKVGTGAKTVLFSMHPRPLTRHQALGHNGRHHVVTDISRPSPVLMVVTTAVVTPVGCLALRPQSGLDEYRRRRFDENATVALRFPAILTEKYLGFEQKEPLARTVTTYVLVTPKEIELEGHDIVRVGFDPDTLEGGEDYAVTLAHRLDEHQNEYEMTRKADL